MPAALELLDVSFGYDAAASVLLDRVTLRFPVGWTGVVGPNGSGKTTLLHLVAGRLTPRSGRVVGAGDVIVCPQRTDDPPEDLAAFIDADDGHAHRLRGRLGIDPGWLARWSTLSHGERKRSQIGAALWRRPAILALDEPTNHVDASTRDALLEMLRTFRGVGLLVSHDRPLLDALCRQCVLLDAGRAELRPGGYTAAANQAESEQESAQRRREHARREQKHLRRVAATRRREAEQADARRSKRKLGRKDHDAKSRIDAARVSGKDGQAGRLAIQLEGRIRQGETRLEALRTSNRRPLGLTMRGVPARRDALWRAAGSTLALGAARRLETPELIVRPHDRIGVTGPNGAGKSTLVERIVGEIDLPPERIVHLPQEIDRVAAAAIVATLDGLPSNRRGDVLAAVDCLGSDPERLLETEDLSPGEVRKLVLALGLAREPHLIVMDEPTNHLDLPSIECLESALGDCDCAMILVSHDQRFLDALATTRWVFERPPGVVARCRVEVAARPGRAIPDVS